MFLHIGQEVSILAKDIVAIFDIKAEHQSESTKEFLRTAEDEGFVVYLTDKPNSFVVTTNKIYLSPISTATLRKRLTSLELSLT